MKKIRITKVRALEGAQWIYLKDGEFREGIEENPPTKGQNYWVRKEFGYFHTSIITAVLPDNQIQTLNSIYQITYL